MKEEKIYSKNILDNMVGFNFKNQIFLNDIFFIENKTENFSFFITGDILVYKLAYRFLQKAMLFN